MTEGDGDLFGVAGLRSELVHVVSHRIYHPETIHGDGRWGQSRSCQPFARLGTETYSSSAERTSSMWLKASGGARLWRLTIVGLRRPCSRPLRYCWLKPESSASCSWVKPFSCLIRLTFRPTSLRMSMRRRSADNEPLIYQL